jgi:hypothetical protein
MKRAAALVLSIGLQTLASPSWAAEPLVGLWRLQQQEINGQATSVEPMALQISESGNELTFAFSVPLPEIYFVTVTYTLRLDGSTADIVDGSGQKVGTIRMIRSSTRQYNMTMTGPGKPDSQGKLTISADGRTLVSESEATQSGRSIHSKQTFTRD